MGDIDVGTNTPCIVKQKERCPETKKVVMMVGGRGHVQLQSFPAASERSFADLRAKQVSC